LTLARSVAFPSSKSGSEARLAVAHTLVSTASSSRSRASPFAAPDERGYTSGALDVDAGPASAIRRSAGRSCFKYRLRSERHLGSTGFSDFQ
jgi:hypothetical protein